MDWPRESPSAAERSTFDQWIAPAQPMAARPGKEAAECGHAPATGANRGWSARQPGIEIPRVDLVERMIETRIGGGRPRARNDRRVTYAAEVARGGRDRPGTAGSRPPGWARRVLAGACQRNPRRPYAPA